MLSVSNTSCQRTLYHSADCADTLSQGKSRLVTGASSGFGQATAALLAAQGFQVFGTSRAPAHSAAGSFELLPLDVCSETSV
jgi:NAD(P)-dependent dehydrogenase (short-subunit alcohol dehydrogenase family)